MVMRELLAISPDNQEASRADRMLIASLVGKLNRYLHGEAVCFDEPVDMAGFTSFRRAVYEAARKIPYGEVRTYGELAKESGFPAAGRAVGRCLAMNPFPIIVPCHRVIGANGHLTGFTRGLDMKRRLLRLEGIETRGSSVAPGENKPR